ncbi:MAG: hypothetical protein Q8N71_04445 [candidate division Zixibacteria bacterium]|nr:hypothetical protein [candidate division Zixibacteria bacterium]
MSNLLIGIPPEAGCTPKLFFCLGKQGAKNYLTFKKEGCMYRSILFLLLVGLLIGTLVYADVPKTPAAFPRIIIYPGAA